MEVMAVGPNDGSRRSRRRRTAGLAAVVLVLLGCMLANTTAAQPDSASGSDEAAVARFYLQSGRWREARDAFEAQTQQPNPPASAYSGLGEAYLHLNERDKAIAAFEAALRLQPDTRAQQRLVDLLAQTKEGWPRATEILKAYLDQHPNDITRRSQLADLLISQSRIREAVAQLAEVVRARPQDADRRLLYARTLAWSGQLKEAHAEFARATAGGAALQGEDQKLVALAAEAAGNKAAAYEHFRAYSEAHPDDADALAGLGRTATATRHFDDADRAIQRLREMSARRPDLAVVVARLEVARGRRDLALPEYERALSHASDPALAKEYADIQGSVGRKKGAREVREAAAPRPPEVKPPTTEPKERAKPATESVAPAAPGEAEEAAALAALATSQLKSGDASAAAETLNKADSLVAKRADLLALRGGAELAQGHHDAAERDYQAALKLDSKHVEATKGLAAVYAASGAYDRAERLLPALKRKAPREHARLSKEIARQRQAQQLESKLESSSDKATEKLLRQAIARSPERSDYRLRLAQLLERERRGKEALALYRDLRVQEPELREAYLGPVRVYIAQGNERQARAAFDEFQRHFPGEEDAVRGALLSVEAEEYKRAGNHQAAVASYRSALELAPNDPKLWNGLAGAFFAARQLNDALAAFEAAAKADPNDVDAANGQVDVLAALASDALNGGDQETARRHIDHALRVGGGSPRALDGLVDMSLATGNFEAAAAAVRRLPDSRRADQLRELVEVERQLQGYRSDPTSADARQALALAERGLKVAPKRDDLLLVRAQALEQLGESDRAVTAYRKLREEKVAPKAAISGEARALAAQGRYGEARATLTELRAQAPEEANITEVGYALAEADKLKRAGKTDAAIALAHRALDIDPDNVDAQLALGGLYSDQKDYALAIAAYQAASARRPDDPFVNSALAGAYFSNGDLEQAASLYDTILYRHPTNPEAVRGRTGVWLATAGRHLAARDLEAADEALDAALALDPNNTDALSMKAQVALAANDWERARALASQLPDQGQGRKISETLSIQERLAQWRADPSTMSARSALQLANRGRELDPYRGDFAYDQARAAELAGDLPAALAHYRRLAEAPDAAAEAYAGQVRVLTSMKRFAEAEQALTAYAGAHPEAVNQERANLRRARAGALLDAGRADEAFEAAREALALDPDDPESLKVLAGVYAKRGQYQDAIDTHRAVLAANPDDPGSLQGIAGAYEALGDWQAAEATYRRLDTIPGYAVSPEAWQRVEFHRDMDYAKQLVEAKRYQEARDLVEELRHRNPRDPDVWAALSEVTLETGADTLALTYAEQGVALNRSSSRLQAARVRALSKLGRFAEARQVIASEQRTLGSTTTAELTRDLRRAQDRVDRERLTREGRLDQVYLLLAQDFRSDPSDVDTLKSIGFLYLQTKQYPEARQFFARAEALAPQDPDARLGLAYALRGSGNARDAVNILEDEYEARKDPELGLALAEMYHDLGRDDDAAEILAETERLGGGGSGFGEFPPLGASGYSGGEPAMGSILPPLKLPQGTLRARPAELNPPAPPRRWKGSQAQAQLATQRLALADVDSMNDAAPPEAAAFAGPALEYLRDVAANDAPSAAAAQLAEELPSFERIMRDVRAKGGKGTPVPTRVPTERAWQRPRVEPTPVPRAPAPPRVRTPIIIEEEEAPSAVRLEWERRHDPSTQGVPRYADPGAIQYEADLEEAEVVSTKPLSPEARARAEALARAIERKRAIKFGVGFRYDFLSSVADWQADEFAIFRFPIFLDVPAALNTRFRITGEPTIVDNGRLTDAGVAGMATLSGLQVGTEAIVLSGGIGGTPAGFPRDPYLIGFAQVDFKLTPGLVLTPFYERQPVMESLLSFRGQELIEDNDRTFIGKVIQDRFGGRIGFDTPVHIDGVIEGAYSTLQGIRIPDNEKFDAFIGAGRTFDLRGYENQIRPGFELSFFHYDEDLSAPVRPRPGEATPPDTPEAILLAVQERRTGGGYFSPDAFAQALLRLDFSGPFFPDTLGDASFLLTGKVGGQWISGVESEFFKDAEGGRVAGGIEGLLTFPIEEVAVLSMGGGVFFADPYNRRFLLVNLVFPLVF